MDKAVRNVVFDLGNVLVWWQPQELAGLVAPQAGDQALLCQEVFGCPQWALLDEGRMDTEAIFAACAPRLPARLHPACQALINDWPRLVRINEPMVRLAGALQKAGYRIYILSNASPRARDLRSRMPLLDAADGVMISAEEKLVKPNPAIYRRLAQTFGLELAQSFFIDDVQANVDGARTAGMQAHRYDGDMQALRRALRAGGLRWTD